jgi:CBS domain-containing protein
VRTMTTEPAIADIDTSITDFIQRALLETMTHVPIVNNNGYVGALSSYLLTDAYLPPHPHLFMNEDRIVTFFRK